MESNLVPRVYSAFRHLESGVDAGNEVAWKGEAPSESDQDEWRQKGAHAAIDDREEAVIKLLFYLSSTLF